MTTKLPYPEYFEFLHDTTGQRYTMSYRPIKNVWVCGKYGEYVNERATYDAETITRQVQAGWWKIVPSQAQMEGKPTGIQRLVELVKADLEEVNVSYKTVVKYNGLTYECARQNSDELLDLVNTLKVTLDGLKKYEVV